MKKRAKWGNLFAAFDAVNAPPVTVGNLIINSSESDIDRSPSGSIVFRCGFQSTPKSEKVIRVFYMHDIFSRDVLYRESERM